MPWYKTTFTVYTFNQNADAALEEARELAGGGDEDKFEQDDVTREQVKADTGMTDADLDSTESN